MDRDNIELAKVFLKQVLAEKRRSIPEVYAYCQAQYRLKKSEIKEARKELGVESKAENGVWYWNLPSDE